MLLGRYPACGNMPSCIGQCYCLSWPVILSCSPSLKPTSFHAMSLPNCGFFMVSPFVNILFTNILNQKYKNYHFPGSFLAIFHVRWVLANHWYCMPCYVTLQGRWPGCLLLPVSLSHHSQWCGEHGAMPQLYFVRQRILSLILASSMSKSHLIRWRKTHIPDPEYLSFSLLLI